MLRMTDKAAALLDETRRRSGLAGDVGLRISGGGSGNGRSASFRLTFATGPGPADVVLRGVGAPVFVASDVAEQLDSAVLDADEQGGTARLVLKQTG